MIERFVLDASVAAKWYLKDEPNVEAANWFALKALRHEIELHAPDILIYELGHLLTKAQRADRRNITSEEAKEGYELFSRFPITFHTSNWQDRLETIDLSIHLFRGYYDCAYLHLAQSLGCRWLTSERRFAKPLHPDFPIHLIAPLETVFENS